MENSSEFEHNYLATLSFVGTAYHGTQIQKNAVTVQEVLQKELAVITGAEPVIKCCSRLDTGVHARMFTLCFFTKRSYVCDTLLRALNSRLPYDIRIREIREVPLDFHARYNARGKRYEYHIWNGAVMDPFLQDRAFHLSRPVIREDELNETAAVFLGKHDFSSFCSIKSDVEDKIRTVYECSVRREGDLIVVTICADGFLYNMARIIAGALVQTVTGKLRAEDLVAYLNGRQRDNRLITLPACGLYLTEVLY